MARFHRDCAASLFLAGTGVLLIFAASRYDIGTPMNPGPGFMGLCCGLAACLLSSVGLIFAWKKEKLQGVVFGPLWHRSLLIFLLLVGFAILLSSLGFVLCTFLFMFVLLKRQGNYGWGKILGWSAGTSIALYLVFQVWLRAQLPSGLLKSVGL